MRVWFLSRLDLRNGFCRKASRSRFWGIDLVDFFIIHVGTAVASSLWFLHYPAASPEGHRQLMKTMIWSVKLGKVIASKCESYSLIAAYIRYSSVCVSLFRLHLHVHTQSTFSICGGPVSTCSIYFPQKSRVHSNITLLPIFTFVRCANPAISFFCLLCKHPLKRDIFCLWRKYVKNK